MIWDESHEIRSLVVGMWYVWSLFLWVMLWCALVSIIDAASHKIQKGRIRMYTSSDNSYGDLLEASIL